jgi:hypothetical protein
MMLFAPPSRREEQFLRLRNRIEQCASRKFDAAEFEGKPPGIVLRCIDFRKLALCWACSRRRLWPRWQAA